MGLIFEITLNQEKKGLWFLKDRPDLSMSFKDPGPKMLDWDELSGEQHQILRLAVLQQHILLPYGVTFPEVARTTQPTVQEVKVPVDHPLFRAPTVISATPKLPEPIQTGLVKRQLTREQLGAKAKELLRKRLPTIAPAVQEMGIDRLELLKIALKQEEEKKRSRPPVIEVLKGKIRELEDRVSKQFTPANNTIPRLAQGVVEEPVEVVNLVFDQDGNVRREAVV